MSELKEKGKALVEGDEEDANEEPDTIEESATVNSGATTSENKKKKKKKKKKVPTQQQVPALLSPSPNETVIYIPQGRMGIIKDPNHHLYCDALNESAIIVFEENGAVTMMNYDGSEYLKSYQIQHRDSVRFFLQKEPVTSPNFLKKARKVPIPSGVGIGVRVSAAGIYQITTTRSTNLIFHPTLSDQLLSIVYRLNTLFDRQNGSKFQRILFDGLNWTLLTLHDTTLSERAKLMVDKFKSGTDLSQLQITDNEKKTVNGYIDEYYNLIQKQA